MNALETGQLGPMMEKEDEAFVETLYHEGKINKYQRGPLLGVIATRRMFAYEFRLAVTTEIFSDDPLIESCLSSLLQGLQPNQVEEIREQLLSARREELISATRKIGQTIIEEGLKQLPEVGITILRDRLSDCQTTVVFSKLVEETYEDIAQIMTIAQERVPIFREQVLKKFYLPPEE